jgi:hypothetical protein
VQGQFWHVLFLSGVVLISQNEKQDWTVHTAVAPDVDPSTLDPHTAIANALSGLTGKPYHVKVDEILVSNVWQPSVYITDKFTSAKSRVFLAGDSAHQLIPTGGYGFNSGVADAVNITWKLAAVLKGYGGRGLLDSYEIERKPVAERNNAESHINMNIHTDIWGRVAQSGKILDRGPGGEALRREVSKHYLDHNRENSKWGVEYGYRYGGSPVVLLEEDSAQEPRWSTEDYVPTTWPGSRAPHVFLEDGGTSIMDLYARMGSYTLVDFTREGKFGRQFESAASRAGIALTAVHLPDESHARTVWERDAVLIRPDDHVCWRAAESGGTEAIDVGRILRTVVGKSG